MANLETVIGLEVHVQINTQSKLFCRCATSFGAEPNTHICPVCTGQPGVLPVLNRQAVDALVKTALALNCRINQKSIFARKQYFYPDLPKNYQISQMDLPLAEKGHLDIETSAGQRRIRIHRIHLEEDAGKLVHTLGNRTLDHSLVDLNRTGIPLMEIVSEPDLHTAEEAAAYLTAIRSIVRYMGVSDGDMEKGSLRCDANISLRPMGAEKLGTKAEIKNMNSISGVKEALLYERERQTHLIESGERVIQETRLWDQDQKVSQSMRSKEEAHDYRYFPDPDLVPIELSSALLDEFKKALPELPVVRQARYEKELNLSAYDAGVLTAEKELSDYFEKGLALFPKNDQPATAKPMANWLTTELLGRLNAAKKTIQESPIPPEKLANLVELVQKGALSNKAGKIVFDEMFQNGGNPADIMEKKGLVQVDDQDSLEKWIEETLAENPKAVQDIKEGKMQAIGALVGSVMKKSKGRANPRSVSEMLRQKLS